MTQTDIDTVDVAGTFRVGILITRGESAPCPPCDMVKNAIGTYLGTDKMTTVADLDLGDTPFEEAVKYIVDKYVGDNYLVEIGIDEPVAQMILESLGYSTVPAIMVVETGAGSIFDTEDGALEVYTGFNGSTIEAIQSLGKVE